MSVTFRGQTWAEHQSELQSDPRSGLTTVRRFQGLRRDLEALIATGFANQYRWNISPSDGPMAELSIEIAGPEIATENALEEDWSYSCSSDQVPLHELPRIATVLASASDLDMRGLRRRLEDAQEANASPALQTNPEVDALIKFRDRGTDSYYRPQPTLIYQATYQSTASYRPAFAVVGIVYTRATLINTFGVPSDMSSGLPASGEWLLEFMEYRRNNKGARSYNLQWRYAVTWGRHPTTGEPFIYAVQ